jgi:hypothetical protein
MLPFYLQCRFGDIFRKKVSKIIIKMAAAAPSSAQWPISELGVGT